MVQLSYHVLDGHDAGKPPVLLIHGGAEDANLLDGQAAALAARGHRTIWYDRRGTGASTRQNWPGGGADQHGDDAAELLRQLGAAPAVVLGFSSGGIIALALAARHPDVVAAAVVWEAPVVTVLPDGLGLQDAMMAGAEAHLQEHPGDYAGASSIVLTAISGGTADLDDPSVRRMSQNAEPFIRDEGRLIVRRTFTPGEVPAHLVTVALGEKADPLHEAISSALGQLIGCPVERVAGADQHQIYVSDPKVLADWLDSKVAGVHTLESR